jgi:hypothetical protein
VAREVGGVPFFVQWKGKAVTPLGGGVFVAGHYLKKCIKDGVSFCREIIDEFIWNSVRTMGFACAQMVYANVKGLFGEHAIDLKGGVPTSTSVKGAWVSSVLPMG